MNQDAISINATVTLTSWRFGDAVASGLARSPNGFFVLVKMFRQREEPYDHWRQRADRASQTVVVLQGQLASEPMKGEGGQPVFRSDRPETPVYSTYIRAETLAKAESVFYLPPLADDDPEPEVAAPAPAAANATPDLYQWMKNS